ncbi:MAG TPA: glycosyltransferase family 4 protein [Solirubrobacteraceae bacterium]|nr:glycosyltransferase family 4 protein [Solirubrobacteraceae bacterium]
MLVHVVDPSAYTPPYDHALCRALAAAGAEVTLFTSRFAYGPIAPADGYARRELFYRAALGAHDRSKLGRRVRVAVKLAEHVPDMLRYRRLAREAEVVHFQWLPVQHLDAHLLPPRRSAAGARRPLVLTAHDILPREPRPGQLVAQRRLYERFDAIVVHSEHGRERLIGELEVGPERVHVIPHGVLRPWEGAPAGECPAGEPRLPPELPQEGEGPVVLFFGLLRPYKGLEELLGAWRGAGEELPAGAELWIVGMPRMDLAPLRAAASGGERPAGGQPAGMRPARRVRLLERFVGDAEIHALMRRADLVVLPYREADQSGVAFTALGAGVGLLLSDVGGFPELAATGAARTFSAGDVAALGKALRELLDDPAALAAMAERARAAADGPYAWGGIARRTLGLYEELLREDPRR